MPEAIAPPVSLEETGLPVPPRGMAAGSDFSRATGLADLQGGAVSPKGRMAMADAVSDSNEYTNIVQPKSIARGIGLWLMGDKEGARKAVTYGNLSTKEEYGVDGNTYRTVYSDNDPNSPLGTMDAGGNSIPLKERQLLRVGQFKTYADTPAGKLQADTIAKRGAELEKTRSVAGKWAAASPEISQDADEISSIADQMGVLPKNVQMGIMSAITAQGELSKSVSKAFQNLASKNASGTLTENDLNEGDLGIGKTKGWVVAKGKLQHSDGTSVSNQELQQAMSNASNNDAINAKYSNTQENAMKSAWYKQLGDKAPLFDRLLEVQRRIDNRSATLANEVGTLPFQFNSNPEKLMNHPAALSMWAIDTQRNAKNIMGFNDWIKNTGFSATNLPAPGELEATYTQTPFYKATNQAYREQAQEKIDQWREKHKEEMSKNASPTATFNVGPVAPPKVNTEATGPIAAKAETPVPRVAGKEGKNLAGFPRVGWTAKDKNGNRKPIYLTPEGERVTE